MGERHGWLFEPTFNRSIKLRQADPRITSDAGALLLREVDHRLGLTADLAAALRDPRDPQCIRYTQTELLRQHLYALALGYAHQDDADRVAHDVALKLAVWDRPGPKVIDERLASQPSEWRLLRRIAESKPNLEAVRQALGEWIGRHQRAAGRGRKAEGAVRFVRKAIRKGRHLACHLDVRIDAGLVNGRVLDAIDDEGARFVGRIKNNARLDKLGEPFLKRPPGRPTRDGDEFAIDLGSYRAESWTRPYRLVLVVIDLPDPKTHLRELFPHYFFLITNWRWRQRGAWELVEHYRKRGTFEDRLGEFNAAIGNGLSADSFAANEAALLLKLLAFNLGGMIRGELEDASGNGWDLKRVQQTVLKAGARVTEHGRRLFVDVAGAAGALWGRLLRRVQRWWRDARWGRHAPRPRRWVAPPPHAHRLLVLRE